MAVLVVLLVAVLAWLFIAPGQLFLPQFSALLATPKIDRSPVSVFSGRSYLTGTFNGREVVVRVQLKRGEYQGYLVIALRTAGSSTLDNNGIEARVRDDRGQRALYSIARHDLILKVEEGWLKALWRPVGFTIFPGRFAPEKWREVLDSMQAVASSLDASSPETGPAS
jgi:hypothetical protein